MQDTRFNGIFASAYTNTNEPARWAAEQFPNASRVLTVAASGDQALFHHLAGAQHIDTFDATPYAKLIQDIKTIAFARKSYEEYGDMLRTLNKVRRADRIVQLDGMADILPHLNDASEQILTYATRYHADVFGAGGGIDDYPNNMPTKDEYERLKSEIISPFNFIFSDLAALHVTRKEEYDLINTSNIFDWIRPSEREMGTLLANLTTLLRPDGRIVYLPQYTTINFAGTRLRCQTTKGTRVLEHEATLQDPATKSRMIVFQRTR